MAAEIWKLRFFVLLTKYIFFICLQSLNFIPNLSTWINNKILKQNIHESRPQHFNQFSQDSISNSWKSSSLEEIELNESEFSESKTLESISRKFRLPKVSLFWIFQYLPGLGCFRWRLKYRRVWNFISAFVFLVTLKFKCRRRWPWSQK